MFTPSFQRLSPRLDLRFSRFFLFFLLTSVGFFSRISVLGGSRSVFVLLPGASGVAPLITFKHRPTVHSGPPPLCRFCSSETRVKFKLGAFSVLADRRSATTAERNNQAAACGAAEVAPGDLSPPVGPRPLTSN